MYSYQNPIIPGYHPDPSICRVGDDFYLVTSTFEFFPGIPIYHSKNLVDWELIGYCLTRDSQLNLEECRCSGGLFAPTIRYHDGVFYMICTNVTGGGNFIVHTRDIHGKWSEPHWIDQPGIDPSVFFDDDGKCYFCNTSGFQGRSAIMAFEIDPMTGKILGDKHIISFGMGGKSPEAPHIYKTRGYYYLMMAEGGTEFGHMETIFRSRQIFGPYTPCPRNPILSHKDYMGSQIQATGHADLMEDQNGNWWMVCLGVRQLGRLHLHNLGRETFLMPVKWGEDGWPIAGNNGTIEAQMQGPLPAEPLYKEKVSFADDFTGDQLGYRWNFVRNPNRDRYSLQGGKLFLSDGKEELSDFTPTFTGVRQQAFCQHTETEFDLLEVKEGGKAGITAFYNLAYYYSLSLAQKDGKTVLLLESCIHGIHTVLAQVPYVGQSARLAVRSDMDVYDFMYWHDGKWESVGKLPTVGLCTEGTMMMTFTGTYMGVFAVEAKAAFDRFAVEKLPE